MVIGVSGAFWSVDYQTRLNIFEDKNYLGLLSLAIVPS